MTPEQTVLRDAFLAEMWPTCPEVPREERAAERALADARTEQMDQRRRDEAGAA